MDIKRLVIGMALAMALMFGWNWVMDRMYAQHPEWKRPGTSPQALVTSAPATRPATASPLPTTLPTSQPAGLEISSAESITASLGSAVHNDPIHSLELITSARGAGINLVTLNQFWSDVDKKNPYQFQKPFQGPDNADPSRVLATRWISINGQQFDLSTVNWTRTSQSDASSVVWSVNIGSALRVTKAYTLYPLKKDDNRQGYEVSVVQTIENTSPQPLSIATAINGPVPPVREIDSVDDRQIVAGYQVEGSVTAAGHTFSQFTADKPALDLTKDKNARPVTWFGASSVYFDAILRPLPAAKPDLVMPLKSVTAQSLNPDEKLPENRMITTALQTDTVLLPPGQRATLPMEVFFGPKQRSLLNNAYYSMPPLGYDSTLSTNLSGCGTYCTFGWLINLLVTLLGFFHMVVRDWGIAIILLVAIVRLCLHPITKKSQMSMLKMGKMGPEIESLKKRYADDKEGLNKAMVGVYKEQGVTPVLGCLPMFLQMPIWVALYSSLQNTFELRQEGFLYNLTWIHDLAKPDRLFWFPAHPVNLYFIHFDAINLLPILMAVVFWLQQKFTPKPAATTPEQQQQQKMMQWMSLLFPVFLYNGPAGLNLYILTSTSVGIIESKRIRDHIKQRDEAEKAGRVFVDATKKMKRRNDDDSAPAKKSGGIAGWLADLQTKAEEMKRNNQKRK